MSIDIDLVNLATLMNGIVIGGDAWTLNGIEELSTWLTSYAIESSLLLTCLAEAAPVMKVFHRVQDLPNDRTLSQEIAKQDPSLEWPCNAPCPSNLRLRAVRQIDDLHRTAVVQGIDVSNSPVSKAVSSPHCADAIHRFMREAYWCSGTSPITAFTPWSIVLIDFISRLGFVSPLFSQDMGVGRLIHRCHRYLKNLISEALPGINTSIIHNTLGSSFGLRCQVALGIRLVPVNPTNVWSIYVQACLYFNGLV